jgi:hypothetical protein
MVSSLCNPVAEIKKVKVNFSLDQAMKAERESRSIGLTFSLTSALDGSGWSTPYPVWTSAENLAPSGIRTPDRPARSTVAHPFVFLNITLILLNLQVNGSTAYH